MDGVRGKDENVFQLLLGKGVVCDDVVVAPPVVEAMAAWSTAAAGQLVSRIEGTPASEEEKEDEVVMEADKGGNALPSPARRLVPPTSRDASPVEDSPRVDGGAEEEEEVEVDEVDDTVPIFHTARGRCLG